MVDALEESHWLQELVEGGFDGHLSSGHSNEESNENGLVHLERNYLL